MTVEQFYACEPHIHGWLKAFTLPSDTILDVGSGDGRHRDIGGASYSSLDVWPPAQPDYLLDLEKKDLPRKRFSVILMIDLLEHLSRERGLRVLDQAQQRASRAVVVLTPLIWDENLDAFNEGFYQGNPAIKHKSLWSLADFGQSWTRVWLPSTQDNFFGYWVKR